MISNPISYTAIIFEFDPVTDTDHVATRQESEPSSSLAEAIVAQESLLESREHGCFRSYVQERHYYGKRYTVTDIQNIKEIRLES